MRVLRYVDFPATGLVGGRRERADHDHAQFSPYFRTKQALVHKQSAMVNNYNDENDDNNNNITRITIRACSERVERTTNKSVNPWRGVLCLPYLFEKYYVLGVLTNNLFRGDR